MALTHLLDTSVYSQPLRPYPVPSVVRRWQTLGDASLSTSVICEAELLFGLEKKKSERLWLEYNQHLKDRIVLLTLDREVASVYAKTRAELVRTGKVKSDFDLLIAATAKARKLILATLNPRHFQGLAGLDVEDWSIDI